MASNLSAADSYATQQAALLKQQLADYYNNLDKSKGAEEQAAAFRKQQLLDVINNNQTKLDTQYATQTKGAYTNKMLEEQRVANELERLGVADQGYGVSQKLKVGTDYDKNITNLGTQYQQGMGDIGLQRTGAEGEYNANLADISAGYSKDRLALDKYVNESSQDVYNKAYAKYVEDQQYQDAMKQQAFENNITRYKTYSTTKETKPQTYTNQPFNTADYGKYTAVKSADGKNMVYTTSTGNKYTLAIGVNPYTGQVVKDITTNGIYDPTKVLSNGYQPNNYRGAPISSSGQKVGDVFGAITSGTSGVDLSGQSIWKTAQGKYLIWDGSIGDYRDVTSQYKASRGGASK